MKDIPNWIKKILDNETLTCGRCDKLFNCVELISIGIQKSNKNSNKEVLFVGFICKECGEMTIFELQEMSLLDLSFEILEEQADNGQEKDDTNNRNKNKIEVKRTKSKITIKEIKRDVDFLQNIKNHDEFLIALGYTPEEIEKFNIKKIEKKRNNENK